MNQRITRHAPTCGWCILIALVFQPMFDPDTTAVTWVATAVMVVVFLPLWLPAGLAERDQRRLTVLLAAMAGLGAVGTLVNAAAGVFIVYAAASRTSLPGQTGRHHGRRAGRARRRDVPDLPDPMPWRLLAAVPIVVFVLVIGATGIIDGERARTQAQLRRADEEIERLATIAERNASHVTCTTCSATPCR